MSAFPYLEMGNVRREGVKWYALLMLSAAFLVPVVWFMVITRSSGKVNTQYVIPTVKYSTSVPSVPLIGAAVNPTRDRSYPTFTPVVSAPAPTNGVINLALTATFKALPTLTPTTFTFITPIYITRASPQPRSPTKTPVRVVVTRIVKDVVVYTAVPSVPIYVPTTVYIQIVITATPQPVVVVSPTIVPTSTLTPTASPTVTFTQTATVTPTFTETPTMTPTFTETPTMTPTFTETPTMTPTFTETPIPVPVSTEPINVELTPSAVNS